MTYTSLIGHRPRKCALVFAVVLAVAGCGEQDGEEEDEKEMQLKEVSAEECLSQKKWVGGDSGAPEMHPGRDCGECHDGSSEAPEFVVSGTVFGGFTESDDCAGVSQAEVVLTDNADKTVTLQTNEAGNFYLPAGQEDLETPLQAEVRYNGETREMSGPVYNTDCGFCHTPERRSRKPGRIVVPGVDPP